MPSSDPRVLEGACREIIIANPKKVLDIGVGFGKWGMLAREYTDIWNYRFYKEEWITSITGIEVHERYQNPIWHIYDQVIIGDAFDVLSDLEEEGEIFDLAIMIDVLEHFEKARGQDLLDKVMKVSGKFLVSYCNSEQSGVRDNKYEDHISTWTDRDFDRFKRKIVSQGRGWATYLLHK